MSAGLSAQWWLGFLSECRLVDHMMHSDFLPSRQRKNTLGKEGPRGGVGVLVAIDGWLLGAVVWKELAKAKRELTPEVEHMLLSRPALGGLRATVEGKKGRLEKLAFLHSSFPRTLSSTKKK